MFTRPITPNEKLYLLGSELCPPFAIQIFVQGTGELSTQELNQAMAKTAACIPGCTLKAKRGDWVASEIPPQIVEVDGPLDLNSQHLWRPLDPYTGPTCELLVSRSGPTTLVFRAFHGAMDGKGVLLWMESFFQNLRQSNPTQAKSTMADWSFLQSRAPHKRGALAMSCPHPLGGKAKDDSQFFYRRLTLPGQHPSFVASLAAITSDFAPKGQCRFMIPVDLRRHVDRETQTTANMSLPLFLDATRENSPAELHQKIIEDLGLSKEIAVDGSERILLNSPLWALRPLIKGLLKTQTLIGKYFGSAILSHLGRVNLNHYSTPGFQAESVWSLPVHAPLAPISMVAVENPDCVELTLTAPIGKEEEADSLLDRIQATIVGSGLNKWVGNDTETLIKGEKSVVSLFGMRAKAFRLNTAILGEDLEVNYGVLDDRSSAMANSLKERGVKKGDVVGIFADRKPETLAAILAVLKRGAAFLPIDPQYPEGRIRFMLSDSGATALISDREQVAEFDGIRFELKDLWETKAVGTEENVSILPEDLAYIIYTSGSTGRPKGVEVSHRNLSNYIYWAFKRYHIDQNSHFALFTSLAFDLSLSSIFLPLCRGGSIATYAGELDHLTLHKILQESGANSLKLTPTHIELFCQLNVQPKNFRSLIVGGEQLTTATARKAKELFGANCEIINEYGPTEATVGCVAHNFDPEVDTDVSVPIGRPASNMKVLLQNGEMILAGIGVAKGYKGQPKLTEEKFTVVGNDRAYRSGDLGRLNPKGELEYLGRKDDQIKIRGHRIEPGELATTLVEFDNVQNAFCMGLKRESGDDVLVAYIVTNQDLNVTEMRKKLATKVPSALIPAVIVPVDNIPLTVNGKVDISVLPDAFGSASASTNKIGDINDPVGEKIAGIWKKVLSVNAPLGLTSDFYLLGGDSLNMLEMLSLVSRDVVGGENEKKFMSLARPLLGAPVLESFIRAAREATQ